MGDLISRQAAIDAIDIYIGNFDAIDANFLDGLKTAKKLMMQLPSAQSETAKRTAETLQNVTDSDLISRKAAIDALDEIRHALWEIDIPSPTVPEYVEHHELVQSVWKLLDKKQKELYVLPSAQPEQKWIPVSETALPQEGKVVIAKGKTGTWDFGTYRGHGEDIHYWIWKKNTFKQVYWWMYKDDALPEPYLEEGGK